MNDERKIVEFPRANSTGNSLDCLEESLVFSETHTTDSGLTIENRRYRLSAETLSRLHDEYIDEYIEEAMKQGISRADEEFKPKEGKLVYLFGDPNKSPVS